MSTNIRMCLIALAIALPISAAAAIAPTSLQAANGVNSGVSMPESEMAERQITMTEHGMMDHRSMMGGGSMMEHGGMRSMMGMMPHMSRMMSGGETPAEKAKPAQMPNAGAVAAVPPGPPPTRAKAVEKDLTLRLAPASNAFERGAPESFPVSELPQYTQINGVAFDRHDPSNVFLATRHGFYRVTPDGIATRVSRAAHDFDGFTRHPSDPSVFYASGRSERGGNLGVIASTDQGEIWQQLTHGSGESVYFHQVDVSKADPDILYGADDRLQVSRDGGQTWTVVGPPPDGLIDLAASASWPDVLYAATETGLLISRNGGQSWRSAYPTDGPVTLVEVTGDGRVYAYALGTGLIRTHEHALEDPGSWQALGDAFSGRAPLHLAVDPTNADRILVTSRQFFWWRLQGRDDEVSDVIRIPFGQRSVFLPRSADTIHSFSLPEAMDSIEVGPARRTEATRFC